jgi:stalled ribosome rescue protein Dom34
METEMGLWIDHRQAFIVTLVGQGEEVTRITSDIEKTVRYDASHGSHDDTTEIRRDRQDRRFDEQLNRYYDEIASHLREATSILILGPGEAKVELQERLGGHGLRNHVVAVNAADKMTDAQIAAEVRQHFRESQRGANRTTQQQQTTKET